MKPDISRLPAILVKLFLLYVNSSSNNLCIQATTKIDNNLLVLCRNSICETATKLWSASDILTLSTTWLAVTTRQSKCETIRGRFENTSCANNNACRYYFVKELHLWTRSRRWFACNCWSLCWSWCQPSCPGFCLERIRGLDLQVLANQGQNI